MATLGLFLRFALWRLWMPRFFCIKELERARFPCYCVRMHPSNQAQLGSERTYTEPGCALHWPHPGNERPGCRMPLGGRLSVGTKFTFRAIYYHG